MGLRRRFGGPVYHLCLLHIGQVLRLLGAVSPNLLHISSLWSTPTVPKVVGTKDQATSNLSLLLDPSSIAKMQS